MVVVSPHTESAPVEVVERDVVEQVNPNPGPVQDVAQAMSNPSDRVSVTPTTVKVDVSVQVFVRRRPTATNTSVNADVVSHPNQDCVVGEPVGGTAEPDDRPGDHPIPAEAG